MSSFPRPSLRSCRGPSSLGRMPSVRGRRGARPTEARLAACLTWGACWVTKEGKERQQERNSLDLWGLRYQPTLESRERWPQAKGNRHNRHHHLPPTGLVSSPVVYASQTGGGTPLHEGNHHSREVSTCEKDMRDTMIPWGYESA